MSAYKQLEATFAQLGDIDGAISILGWDAQVMMPHGAAEVRGEQLATLTRISHDLLLDPALAPLALEAEGEVLDQWQKANLRLIQRNLKDAAAVSSDLAAAMAKASMETEHAWREARKTNDYKSLLPQFAALLDLVRERVQIYAGTFGFGDELYDAALDMYQPGLTHAYFQPVFDDLSRFLPDLLEKVLVHQANCPPMGPVPARVAVETQRGICEALVRQAGFDFERGRLDISTHPFCGGVPGDIRLTTRYAEDEFLGSIMGTIHETGHALYDMNLPPEFRRQPVGRAAGMMIHESQSLIMEMQAGLSPQFAGYLARKVGEATGEACTGADLYRYMSKVERSFIRVDADEVTYPLHVILRTGLEKALLLGDLQPADLPVAWNDGFRQLIGLMPPNDTQGCLQDPHWYSGAIGYFPTYTLGAMTAAQLFRAAVDANPAIPGELEQGSFAGLQAWLKTNIHSRASSLNGLEVIQAATGKPLDPEIYKAHLRKRYLGQG